MTEQQRRITWPQVRNRLVEVLELKAMNNGADWTPDDLIAAVDRMRRTYKSLRDKEGPPTLTAMMALHEENYREIAYALGVPGSESGKTFTVGELIGHIRAYVNRTNDICSEMTQRAEAAEAKLAEDAKGWDVSCTELVERIKTLEAELAYARDGLELNQIHESIGEEMKQGHELAAARNLVRALEAEKQLREMSEELEIAQSEASLFSRVGGPQAEENASRVLRDYDQLTLGLSYLWGDEPKEEFIRLLRDDPQFMDRLEAKYRKSRKKARKAGNR